MIVLEAFLVEPDGSKTRVLYAEGLNVTSRLGLSADGERDLYSVVIECTDAESKDVTSKSLVVEHLRGRSTLSLVAGIMIEASRREK